MTARVVDVPSMGHDKEKDITIVHLSIIRSARREVLWPFLRGRFSVSSLKILHCHDSHGGGLSALSMHHCIQYPAELSSKRRAVLYTSLSSFPSSQYILSLLVHISVEVS